MQAPPELVPTPDPAAAPPAAVAPPELTPTPDPTAAAPDQAAVGQAIQEAQAVLAGGPTNPKAMPTYNGVASILPDSDIGVGGAFTYHKIKSSGGPETVAAETRAHPTLLANPAAPTGLQPQTSTPPPKTLRWLNTPPDYKALSQTLLTGSQKSAERAPQAEAWLRIVGQTAAGQIGVHQTGVQMHLAAGLSNDQATARAAQWVTAQFDEQAPLMGKDVQDLWTKFRAAPEAVSPKGRAKLATLALNLGNDMQQSPEMYPGHGLFGLKPVASVPHADSTFSHVLVADTAPLVTPPTDKQQFAKTSTDPRPAWSASGMVSKVVADTYAKTKKGMILPSPVGAPPVVFGAPPAPGLITDTPPNVKVPAGAVTVVADHDGARLVATPHPDTHKILARWYEPTSLDTGQGQKYWAPRVPEKVPDMQEHLQDVFNQDRQGGTATVFHDTPAAQYPGMAPDRVIHVTVAQSDKGVLDAMTAAMKQAGVPYTEQKLGDHDLVADDGKTITHTPQSSSAFHFDAHTDAVRGWDVVHQAPAKKDAKYYGAGPGEQISDDSQWAHEHMYAGRSGGFYTTLTAEKQAGRGIPVQVGPDVNLSTAPNKLLETGQGPVKTEGGDIWFGHDTLIPQPTDEVKLSASSKTGLKANSPSLSIVLGGNGLPNIVGVGANADATVSMKAPTDGTVIKAHVEPHRVSVFVPGAGELVDRAAAEQASALVARMFPGRSIGVFAADKYKAQS